MTSSDLTFSALAERAGLTTAKLGQKFGIPRRTTQHWATGERTPPEYVLRMIETILDFEEKNKEAVD